MWICEFVDMLGVGRVELFEPMWSEYFDLFGEGWIVCTS